MRLFSRIFDYSKTGGFYRGKNSVHGSAYGNKVKVDLVSGKLLSTHVVVAVYDIIGSTKRSESL